MKRKSEVYTISCFFRPQTSSGPVKNLKKMVPILAKMENGHATSFCFFFIPHLYFHVLITIIFLSKIYHVSVKQSTLQVEDIQKHGIHWQQLRG